ncbi:hypothetical protein K0M31_011124 [Melipona bicolor]|uniref:Uncharacterized protein n=1 Tax=Melipona bicolor TaxID=60889 RepID=A0AA40G8X4_9HYME|nr:hypothetical protein K0M31_011124 [Melipona bicolor]
MEEEDVEEGERNAVGWEKIFLGASNEDIAIVNSKDTNRVQRAALPSERRDIRVPTIKWLDSDAERRSYIGGGRTPPASVQFRHSSGSQLSQKGDCPRFRLTVASTLCFNFETE